MAKLAELCMETKMKNALENGSVMIYGAHLVAVELYRYLRKTDKNFRFIGFAVTASEGNPAELEGEKVFELQKFQDAVDKQTTIMIAMPKKYHSEAEAYARKFGFSFFIKVSLEEMSEIKGRQLLCEHGKRKNPGFSLYEDIYDKSWLNLADSQDTEMCGWNPGKRHYKFPTLYYRDVEDVFQETERFDFYRDFERVFGTYHNLHSYPAKALPEKNAGRLKEILSVYMVFSQWDSAQAARKEYPGWIRPIQAGSVLSDKKAGDYLDETGDSISGKNSVLAEMTAAYWIWKNAEPAKYKGLCHYRRHFVLEENEVLSLAGNGIDVILTTPRYTPGGIREMFLAETPVKEPVFHTLLCAIEECHPEDREAFTGYMEECLYCPNNMVIARSEIYDAYCEWIFPVLFRMMEIDEENGYGHERDRHVAYAAELLTSLFFAGKRDEYCIAMTDYRFYG